MKMYANETEESAAGDTWGPPELPGAEDDVLWAGVWDKQRPDRYDFLDLDLNLNLDELFDEEHIGDILNLTSLDPVERKEIVHHDCMWAGTCSDKYHPGNWCQNAVKTSNTSNVNTNNNNNSVHQQQLLQSATVQSTPPGRSLLISAVTKPEKSPVSVVPVAQTIPKVITKQVTVDMQSSPSPRRPDTPQSLDEEEIEEKYHQQRYNGKHNICNNSISKKIVRDYDYCDGDEDEDDEDEGYEDDDYRHHMYYESYQKSARENTIASDHSYTLSKNSKQARVDLPGVQTPSDSEEEIDVVSLGEKMVGIGRVAVALPANPSPLARRQLQRTMASAVAEHSGLSARPPLSQPLRKRPRDRSASPPLRHRKRNKPISKPRFHQSSARHSPTKRRSHSSPNSDSEAETMERRSLHNDMERQRRIGLKNLFDELKTEVPSICHKERAPKVVVLREAAALCVRLQREENERKQLKAKQERLLAQVRQLRLDLATRRPKNA